MTEAEWLAETDSVPMYEFLRASGKANERKLRLFSCAYVRLGWHLLHDDRSRKAIEVSELYADGMASKDELADARQSAMWATKAIPNPSPESSVALLARHVADDVDVSITMTTAAYEGTGWEHTGEREALFRGKSKVAKLFHEVFGNPFRSVTLDRAWLTGTVTALATAIYTDRAFNRLPILADALEDAGCTLQDILDHCRQPGEHCRGCWALDLVLGKS